MILTLLDVAEMLAMLGIVDRSHIYCGKMDDKKSESIGVYNAKRASARRETIGGDENSSYRTKSVTFLVHWSKSTEKTEKAAETVYEAVRNVRNSVVNGKRILFIRMQEDSPIDVGTDDNGVYEMVIDVEIYYERRG